MGVENQIIEGCRQGKRKFQKALFEMFKAPFFGICLRYCKSKDEAEDVLMMAFMNIFSEIQTYRGEGSVEGWMRRIVVNSAINNYKKNLKHYYHAEIDEIAETDIEGGNDIEVPDYMSSCDLIKAIQELPEGYRMVLNLYIVEGYKHKEIAEMLGIDIGTSKSQLFKARKLLQESIAKSFLK